MSSLDFLIWLESLRNPVADVVFGAAAAMGSERFYMALLLTVYLCVSHRFGFKLLVMFLLSAWGNAQLKSFFATTRPFDMYPDQLQALHTDSAHGNAFPSGHAQSAAVVWGLLAARARSRGGMIACIVIIALIAFCRLYLGVHWPADVIGGLLIGAGMLAAYLGLASVWQRRGLRLSQAEWWLVLIIATAALFALGFTSDTCLRATGALFGTSVGYLLLERRGYDPSAPLAFQVVKVVFALGLLLVMRRIGMDLAEGIPQAVSLVYVVTGITGAYLLPMLYSWLGGRLQASTP